MGAAVSSAPKYTSNPDYYAPAAKPSTSTATTTVTMIVTPGQETATSKVNTGSDGGATYTCYETYPGTNPIPQPTSEGSGSGSGAGSSYAAPSSYIPAKSSSSSVVTNGNSASSTLPPFPVGNGTTVAGSTGMPSGMPTGSSRTSTFLSSSFGTASATSSSATSNATLSDCSTL